MVYAYTSLCFRITSFKNNYKSSENKSYSLIKSSLLSCLGIKVFSFCNITQMQQTYLSGGAINSIQSHLQNQPIHKNPWLVAATVPKTTCCFRLTAAFQSFLCFCTSCLGHCSCIPLVLKLAAMFHRLMFNNFNHVNDFNRAELFSQNLSFPMPSIFRNQSHVVKFFHLMHRMFSPWLHFLFCVLFYCLSKCSLIRKSCRGIHK